jgi:hypothetical protein
MMSDNKLKMIQLNKLWMAIEVVENERAKRKSNI